ncbi:hypothetical protein KAM380_094800 [Aeromonas caviae]|nr:hypothetical protein KAM380_094800 [Aeromonas caviae]
MSPNPNAQGGTNPDMPTSPDPDDDPLMNEEEGGDWQEDDARQRGEQPAVDLDQRRE